MTTSTLTVTEFVLARIAEDEAAAREALRRAEVGHYYLETGSEPLTCLDQGVHVGFAPARVLAQCAAMRKIVELNSWVDPSGNRIEYGPDSAKEIAALASIWSDHPDWREEWR